MKNKYRTLLPVWPGCCRSLEHTYIFQLCSR